MAQQNIIIYGNALFFGHLLQRSDAASLVAGLHACIFATPFALCYRSKLPMTAGQSHPGNVIRPEKWVIQHRSRIRSCAIGKRRACATANTEKRYTSAHLEVCDEIHHNLASCRTSFTARAAFDYLWAMGSVRGYSRRSTIVVACAINSSQQQNEIVLLYRASHAAIVIASAVPGSLCPSTRSSTAPRKIQHAPQPQSRSVQAVLESVSRGIGPAPARELRGKMASHVHAGPV